MNKFSNLILNKDWNNIIAHYQPKALAESLHFREGRDLVYQMLFNEECDDQVRDYATELLEEIRQTHGEEWMADWKNDVFLGDACYLTMKYEERYEAYKRAYEKINTPPPSLLISLAGCYLLPQPPITLDEAEKLTQKALEQEMSIEGVVLLRGIYAEKKDRAKFEYWDKILKEVTEKDLHTQETWPDFSKP